MNNQNQNTTKVLLFLTIVLTITALALIYAIIKQTSNLKITQEEKALIQEEKIELENKLKRLILDYDSLKTNNDSINRLLELEQEKIKKLLALRASDAEKIRIYKKELETLRKVMRSYIIQIDSLNTRNKILTEENIKVKKILENLEKDHETLKKEKEELSQKVNLASVLSARNITVEGINKNGKPKERISKIEIIKVCFTIRENAIAKPGSKIVYLRLVRPDNIVLTSDESEIINVGGEDIMTSARRQIEYENKDLDVCIYWNKKEELIKGTYKAILYCEGYEIGSTTFDLK